MRILVLLVPFLMFSSCSGDEKRRIEGGDLTVYFSNDSSRDEAKKLALFWKENGFLTGNKQDVELNEFQEEFQLKLIQNPELADIDVSIKDRKNFHELMDTLNASIFTEKPVKIHICNPNLKTITVIE